MPVGHEASRPAGEGDSHTARAHIPEESDSGIVPMNHSNQGGKPPAENEEGRPPIKENTHQSGTHPTQSGARVSQGLAGVRKAAREGKERKFTALLHHLTVGLLRASFYALKRKAAPGVDGVTWQEYETGLEGRLVDLHSRVHRGAYRAKPSRRAFIQKSDGRPRPLGVAALEDKGRPTGRSHHPQSDLRGGISRLLVWFPAGAQPASGAGCVDGGAQAEAGELCAGRRHPEIFGSIVTMLLWLLK